MKAQEKEEATKRQSVDEEGEADIGTTFLMNLVNKRKIEFETQLARKYRWFEPNRQLKKVTKLVANDGTF